MIASGTGGRYPSELCGRIVQFDLRLVGDGGLEPSTPCL